MTYRITHYTPANATLRRLDDVRNEGSIDGYATRSDAESALADMRAQAIANGAQDYAAELAIEQADAKR